MIVLTSSAIFSLLSFSIHCSGLLKQLDVYICDFWNRFVHHRQCSQPQEILEFSLFFPWYNFKEQTPCKPASAKTTESIHKLYSTHCDKSCHCMSSATITTEKNNHGNVAKGLVGHVKANRKSCGKPCVKPCGRPVPGKVHKKKDRITPQVNFFQ